jgi:multimeric flavodoxin WrbA
MKKITAIIGSPLSENKSNTAALTRLFCELIKEKDDSIEYEIISLGNKKVNMCKGCWVCTSTGDCILKDDISFLKEKLQKSDLIILGSPVYVHSVSAQFKAFADRIFIWYHLMKLIGKPAITAVTTAKTGRKPTEKYLNFILCALGAIPIGHIGGIGFKPCELQNKEKLQKEYENLANKTLKILKGKKKIKPTLLNKLIFWGIKMKAKYGKKYLPFEHNYWQEKGWFNKSYIQVIKEFRQ